MDLDIGVIRIVAEVIVMAVGFLFIMWAMEKEIRAVEKQAKLNEEKDNVRFNISPNGGSGRSSGWYAD